MIRFSLRSFSRLCLFGCPCLFHFGQSGSGRAPHRGSAHRHGEATWASAATTFVSLSALRWVTSLPWARVIGGFPFYDPVLLRFYLWGFLTSLTGLLTGILGKGKLRWPSCGLSVLMTFLWFAAALGE